MHDDKKRIDWDAIRAEYIGGGISQRDIAEKHGLSWSTLQKRASREGWAKDRKKVRAKLVERVAQKAAAKNADNATLAADIKRKGLLILNRLFDDFEKVNATEHRDYDGKNLTDIKRLRDLTAAYKDLTDDMPCGEAEKNKPVYELLRRLDDECNI